MSFLNFAQNALKKRCQPVFLDFFAGPRVLVGALGMLRVRREVVVGDVGWWSKGWDEGVWRLGGELAFLYSDDGLFALAVAPAFCEFLHASLPGTP